MQLFSKNFHIPFYLLSICTYISATAASIFIVSAFQINAMESTSEIKNIKKKWVRRANMNVRKAKMKILKANGISSSSDWHNLITKNDRSLLKKQINEVIQNAYSDYKNVNTPAYKAAQSTAEKIFKKRKVKIIHDPKRKKNGITIECCYKPACSYIRFNTEIECKDLLSLKYILLHEYSHTKHNDALRRLLIKQALAKKNNKKDNSLFALSQACELRADINVVLNSSDHGKKYIEGLKKAPNNNAPGHPSRYLRVKITQKVKDELDSSEVKHTFMTTFILQLIKATETLTLKLQQAIILTLLTTARYNQDFAGNFFISFQATDTKTKDKENDNSHQTAEKPQRKNNS